MSTWEGQATDATAPQGQGARDTRPSCRSVPGVLVPHPKPLQASPDVPQPPGGAARGRGDVAGGCGTECAARAEHMP